MADILAFQRKQPSLQQLSSAMNSGSADASQAAPLFIEDLECGPWTTRKLKISTSTSGYLIIECFESADGKRLRGSSKMEPEFRLSNLNIMCQNAFGFDELKMFIYDEKIYNDTDFMSHVVNYCELGDLIVVLSLKIGDRIVQCKLWF